MKDEARPAVNTFQSDVNNRAVQSVLNKCEQRAFISALPPDILLMISSQLNPKDLSRLSITCSVLNRFIHLAWQQWLSTRHRIRILSSCGAHNQLQVHAPALIHKVGRGLRLNWDLRDLQDHKVELVGREECLQVNEYEGPRCRDHSNRQSLEGLLPIQSAYRAAHTYLVDRAWQLRPSLRATILPLSSSSAVGSRASLSYRLYSRGSLSLPILKLCSRGLLLFTRDRISFWDSELLKKTSNFRVGSIGDSSPQLFELKQRSTGRGNTASSAWDDVSCCQVLNPQEKTIRIVVGRVNGSLECWTLLLPASSLQTASSTDASSVRLDFRLEPPSKTGSAGAAASVSSMTSDNFGGKPDDTQDQREPTIGKEALDGSEIQAISSDSRGLVAVATKRGKISVWNSSAETSSLRTVPNVGASAANSSRTCVPGGTDQTESQTLSQVEPSKNTRRRAKRATSRTAKIEASRQPAEAKPRMQLLSTWKVPSLTEGINGTTRIWSILLGGDESGKTWVSIGMTGTNPVLIYPLDPITSEPLTPFHLSASGRPTSVYALASTSMYFSGPRSLSGTDFVIPSYLLFTGCYDGSVRVYDLREVSQAMEEESELSNLTAADNFPSIDLSSLVLDPSEPSEPSDAQDKRVLQAVRTFKDRFGDSAIYDLALGGGEGKMIMAGTARNGVVRIFKWPDVEEERAEMDMKGQYSANPSGDSDQEKEIASASDEGFSIFAGHPSTGPIYSMVADFDRLFGATDTNLWELDFRPTVRLPGENYDDDELESVKDGARNPVADEGSSGSAASGTSGIVGSRAYYKHGDMNLDHTGPRIGD